VEQQAVLKMDLTWWVTDVAALVARLSVYHRLAILLFGDI
jgi:hypothetical protein